MAELNWTSYGAAQTVTGGIASLAIDAWQQSAEIDNTTGLDLYLDIAIEMASPPVAGSSAPHIPIYLLPSTDGTNYPNPPASATGAAPACYHVGSVIANASAAFTRGWLRGVVLPPGKVKLAVQNKLGVAFPADAVLKVYPYSEASA